MFGSHVGRANADFGAGLLAAGELAALRAAFAGCDVNARGGVFKQTALAFVGCPDALSRWLVERGTDLSAGDAYARAIRPGLRSPSTDPFKSLGRGAATRSRS